MLIEEVIKVLHIAEALAKQDPLSGGRLDYSCFYCGAWIEEGEQHAEDCKWTALCKLFGLSIKA